jgi:hypothetical protein
MHAAPLACSHLRREGAFRAAAAVGVRPRSAPHLIVPPRFFVPLGAPKTALPFQGWSEQDAYAARRFTGATMLEQYVEWEAATDGGDGSGGGKAGSKPRRASGRPSRFRG